MRLSAALAFAGFVFAVCVIAHAAPAQPNYSPRFAPRSAFCVERLEDNGAINLEPVTVWLDAGQPEMTFRSGGGAACFFLPPGPHKAHLRWNKGSWTLPRQNGASNTVIDAPPADFRLASAQRLAYEICSHRDPAGEPSWRVVPRGRCGTS